jgi:hypothetical protein
MKMGGEEEYTRIFLTSALVVDELIKKLEGRLIP